MASSSSVFVVEVEGSTLVVEPQPNIGNFDEETTAALHEEWKDLVQRLDSPDIKNVLMDMGKLEYFGSLMLKRIVKLWKRVREQNGSLVVCSASDVGIEVLGLASQEDDLQIFSDREQALEAMNAE